MWPENNGISVGGSPLLTMSNYGANANPASSIMQNNSGVALPVDTGTGGGSSLGGGLSFLGDATNKGWGGLALQGLGGAASLYMGMQQYGLAKDALKQSKEQYAKNYAAQKSMTNASLSDRQIARNAAGPGYQDTAGYMAQYGIK
jgi:hypothetical protein